MSRPAALAFSTDNCSVARTLDVVGEKWTLMVLREVFLGVRRFQDIHVHAGIPRQVLSKRLTSMVEAGLLRQEPYHEPGSRTRNEYRLTEAGAELVPSLLSLMAWGDAHLADAEGPALRAVHRGCGEPVTVVVRCAAGHDDLSREQVLFEPGEGARRRP
jgi:DNA-binding HxlR family transcriptional regulator